MAGDYEVTKNKLNIPHPYTADDARYWLHLTQQTRAQHTAFPFLLELRANGEFVGGVRPTLEPRFDRAEVSY